MNPVDGNHVYNFWGNSPALDFKWLVSVARTLAGPTLGDEAALAELSVQDRDRPLRVLQVNVADARHTLTTLCRAWRRSPEREVHLHVHEIGLEGLARHMLLVSVLLDARLLTKPRMQVLLELLCNVFLQEKTAAYLAERGAALAELVLRQAAGGADENRADGGGGGKRPVGPSPPLPDHLFDLSALKFKERDELVEIFRAWSTAKPFDMAGAWEARLRKFYGDRYDHRKNLVDWDYHMRLSPAGASIVHFIQFRDWRTTGLGYELGDCVYKAPNRSLVSTVLGRAFERYDKDGKPAGRSISSRGLWSDVANAPYLSFGIQAEDASLFKITNKQHEHDAVRVAQYNVTCLLHELTAATKYVAPAPEPEPEPPTEEEAKEAEPRIKELDAVDEGDESSAAGASPEAAATEAAVPEREGAGPNAAGEEAGPAPKPEEKPWWLVSCGDGPVSDGPVAAGAVARFRIVYTAGDLGKAVTSRSKNRAAFDAIAVGNRYAHEVKHGLEALARPGCILAVESAKYMVDLKKEQADEFGVRLKALAVEAGWVPLGGVPEGVDDVHLLFTR